VLLGQTSSFPSSTRLIFRGKGMGHSQSSDFPLRAVLTNPAGIKGAIFLETTVPTRCLQFTDQEIAKLAAVPILFEFNDHLDQQPTGVLASFNNCKALVDKINAAGGDATMLHPAELGIHGNSHMVMLDKNNLQIADLILKWIDEHVGKKTTFRTLAPRKEGAVAEAKQKIDRVLTS
jgi:hypothetical protein